MGILRLNSAPVSEFYQRVDAPEVLSDEDQLLKEICSNSFYEFLKAAWEHGVPGSKFIDNWHIGAIAEHLEAMYRGQITRLLVNQPPRTSKSSLCTVLFPVWLWTKRPEIKIISASYAHSLAIRDSVASRRLIQSRWFQKLWPMPLADDVNSKIRYDNKHGGFRLSTSVGGSALGEGSEYQIVDDGNAGNESDIDRGRAIDWYKNIMSNRYTIDPKDFRRVLIQQRTHELDLSGFILSLKDPRWVHLMLPMEFEPSRRCVTVPLYNKETKKIETWKDPRKKEGELLWPSLIGAKQIKIIKEMEYGNDSYVCSGMLQQRPSPEGGGIFKSSWVVLDENSHQYSSIISSWDTSLVGGAGKGNAFSACTTWGVYQDNQGVSRIHLISLVKCKIEFPDLRQLAFRLSQNVLDVDLMAPAASSRYPADLVLIEAKVSGFSLADELSRMNVPVHRFNPNTYGDKTARARRVTDLFEDGKISIRGVKNQKGEIVPDSTGRKLLDELELFPHGESKDVVDSVSQALIYIKHTLLVSHSLDHKWNKINEWTAQAERQKKFGFDGL